MNIAFVGAVLSFAAFFVIFDTQASDVALVERIWKQLEEAVKINPGLFKVNFDKDQLLNMISGLLGGALPDPDSVRWIKRRLRHKKLLPRKTIPKFFNVTEKWPLCSDSFLHVRNQEKCSACFAVGPSTVIADRICMKNYGKPHEVLLLSPQDILDCCPDCGDCEGGTVQVVYDYIKEKGIVTGGDYNEEYPTAKQGCKPYSKRSAQYCEKCGNGNQCVEECQAEYNVKYSEDKYKVLNVTVVRGEREMQMEIMENGPISTSFRLTIDMTTYAGGVYTFQWGEFMGIHHVKIIGWGEEIAVVDMYTNEKKMTPYWLVVNSWGSEFGGTNGLIKIARNHKPLQTFETAAYAPTV